MKIEPTEDRVLVKKVTQDEVSAGGIYLGASTDQYVSHGEVIAMGPGVFDSRIVGFVPMGVSAGDKVIFSSRSGLPVKAEGKEFLLMGVTEIVGIIRD